MAAHGKTPQTVAYWTNFVDDARQYHPETIFVDVQPTECSNESEVGNVFTANIILNLEKFIMKITKGEGLKSHQQT